MVMALSRTDWIEAALVALAEVGLRGVAVEPLARRLGATKGSFYWHFADRSELIDATLELWERRETTEVIERIEELEDPYQRLTALATRAYASAAGGNAHAAVLAAASEPRVGEVLARVTRTRLAYLTRLYRELGRTPDDAARYARLAYALYLGVDELRRVPFDDDPSGPALDELIELAVETMVSTPRHPAGQRSLPASARRTPPRRSSRR
jgi:AcrR family transcriptional regulator